MRPINFAALGLVLALGLGTSQAQTASVTATCKDGTAFQRQLSPRGVPWPWRCPGVQRCPFCRRPSGFRALRPLRQRAVPPRRPLRRAGAPAKSGSIPHRRSTTAKETGLWTLQGRFLHERGCRKSSRGSTEPRQGLFINGIELTRHGDVTGHEDVAVQCLRQRTPIGFYLGLR